MKKTLLIPTDIRLKAENSIPKSKNDFGLNLSPFFKINKCLE